MSAGSFPDGRNLSFTDGCVRTYGAATRLMGDVWEQVSGQPMPTLSGSPKSRFQEALRLFEGELRASQAKALKSGLADAAAADPVLKDLLDDSLATGSTSLPRDIDDVPPNVFKQSIRDEAKEATDGEKVDVDLDVFLRTIVTRVMAELKWERRLNVGANRHFPRMFQWLREIEDETTDDDGRGLRIMNRSGTGRVAAEPAGPHTLRVRLDPAYF